MTTLRVLGWTAVLVLGCAAGAAAEEVRTDERWVEAQSAFDEATKLGKAGKYTDAIPLGERALALREAVLGSTHPEVANCLNLLGDLYGEQGDFSRAERILERGLAIREAALDMDPLDVARSLNSLGRLYMHQDFYSRAERLFLRALAIREAALGKDHPDVAKLLNNLGINDAMRGFYGRAEPLYERALSIRETALGKNHSEVAQSLNNLAALYAEQGLYSRAEPLHLRALAIREESFGKNHFSVGVSLSNLAILYKEQGLYSRAEPLYQRGLGIFEAVRGKNHFVVASSLNNLGNLYRAQGLYGRAEPLHLRALAIREETFGKNHPLVAESLNNVAGLYASQGLYTRAEPLFQRGLGILKATLVQNHPDVAAWLNDFAQVRLAQHRLAEALPLLASALALSESRLREEALAFSGSRLESFLQHLHADEERLYALLRAHPDDARVRRLAIAAALLRKGRSVEETADTSRTVYRSLGAQDRDTFERLRGLRTQLAELSLNGPGPLTPADYQQRLKALAEQGDTLEADLAKRSAPLRALRALPPPDEIVDRVAAALPRESALVEFIAYTHRPLVPRRGTPESKVPTQLRYLALVLFPDGHTRALDLGPAAPIDRESARLRDALGSRDDAHQGAARTLYQLAFGPLKPLLGDVRRLFLAPDGQLGLIPFAALHDGRRYLVETFDFTYLTSGKELLPRPDDSPPPRSVVVLADPDFGASLSAPPSPPGGAPGPADRSYSVERFFATLRADLADHPWALLPGTRQEAEAIQRLLPEAQLFLGADATKERLLHLPTPGILHIATHGFFLDDDDAPPGARAVKHDLGDGGPARRPPNPLLRSGLVLAGAGAPVAQGGPTAPRRLDDVLVTALELAGLDLWGTELVVLSACDTGRGDIKLGQGVYGLRRALVVAGAETLVMSLWKVDDETTRALMEGYYRNLLASRGRATALREAMLALREQHPHPHFWAPFIAIGRDAPLRGLTPHSPPPPGP